jgi:hypothetical protein
MLCKFTGSKPLRNLTGRVVITFGKHLDYPELRPDYTASVLGHRSCLIATCEDLFRLADYVYRRFAGRVEINSESDYNPLQWEQVQW